MRVIFELTYRCHFRCRHCYVPASYQKKARVELTTKEVFSILDQLKDLGCFYLGFTGGEPFLREDIFKILWYAKKKGFQIIIYTNGSLIDKAKAEELKQLNPNKVDITIPAISKRAFEQITGVKGSCDNVFKAIRLLHKNGVRLGFKSCLLKENEKEIKEIQDFAASLGALHRLDDRLSPRLDGDREPYRHRGFRKQIVTRSPGRQVTSKDKFEACGLNFQKSEHNTQYTIHNTLFKCGVGVSQAAITPYGELKMCLMIDYPKYKILNKYIVHRTSHIVHPKDGLKYAWERLKELVASIKPDKNYQCDKCQFCNDCKWWPGQALLYNRTFTACDPESQYRAE